MHTINFYWQLKVVTRKRLNEVCMKTAADEVRCLVAEEKHDTVSENSNITTLENCSDGTDSLFRIVLLMMSLLLILLFQVMVLGRKGDTTHLMLL